MNWFEYVFFFFFFKEDEVKFSYSSFLKIVERNKNIYFS